MWRVGCRAFLQLAYQQRQFIIVQRQTKRVHQRCSVILGVTHLPSLVSPIQVTRGKVTVEQGQAAGLDGASAIRFSTNTLPGPVDVDQLATSQSTSNRR